MQQQSLTLAFVSSAYNEAGNLEELYRRCQAAHAELGRQLTEGVKLRFRFVVADNCSGDRSLSVLEELSRRDPDVIALANRANYGPEASAVNALRQAADCDLIVLLCSDLQDPPELAVTMGRTLLEKRDVDAVMAVKQRSVGGPLLRMARRSYYKMLGYSSRLKEVPSGFHSFGCYRQAVIVDALRYWNSTDLSFRQCLTNACQSPVQLEYIQAERLRGLSSYRGWGYWPEALRAILSGDAAASRLALTIGGGGLLLSVLVGIFILANVMGGRSGYGGGVPTVIGLLLISFAVQMLMFAVLSRQIESLRMGGLRPKVRYWRLSEQVDET